MDIVNKDQKDADFKVIKADVHEGVAGIVAGKLKDEFNRPCIIVTESDGKLKGTGRSIPEVNIYELLKKNEELFIRFGGHKSACGFLMEAKNLEVLQKSLQKDLSDLKKKNKGIFDVEVAYDMELEIGEVSIELARVSTQRVKLGVYQNRLEHTINNLNTAAENLTSAESRIRDTDMAKEIMNFTKLQIMLQAGTSMLAQANQLPQSVLTLIR